MHRGCKRGREIFAVFKSHRTAPVTGDCERVPFLAFLRQLSPKHRGCAVYPVLSAHYLVGLGFPGFLVDSCYIFLNNLQRCFSDGNAK